MNMNIWLLSYSVIKGNPNGGVDELMVILDNQWWQLMIPTICDVFYAAANWPDNKTVGVNDEQVGDVGVRLQRCVQHHCSDPGDGHLWLTYILMKITLYPGHHHKLPCSLRSRWRGIVARTQGLSRSQRWSLPRLKGLDIMMVTVIRIIIVVLLIAIIVLLIIIIVLLIISSRQFDLTHLFQLPPLSVCTRCPHYFQGAPASNKKTIKINQNPMIFIDISMVGHYYCHYHDSN